MLASPKRIKPPKLKDLPLTLTQARQLEEWNARIEVRHHDRSTKHNTSIKSLPKAG